MNKRVLIVEDDESLAELYAIELSNHGFEIETAVDGQDGLDQILTKKFDLVVVDLMLPKIDGLTIVESIRRSPKTKTLPIVMLSNLSEGSTVEQALKAGANGYLVKAQNSPSSIATEVQKFLS